MARTILIADNDVTTRSFLQSVLEQEGYELIHAESAEQALAITRTAQIDGFFLDIAIPGTNGIGLCRALRGMPEHRNTPIAMSGARSGAELDAQAVQYGDIFCLRAFFVS